MNLRSFSHSRGPRRAAVIDPTQALAPSTGRTDDGLATLVRQGLAAAAVSALGLGLAGGVALTAGAQAEQTTQSTVTGQGSYDTTQAQAQPPAPEQDQQAAVENEKRDDEATGEGALEAFARSGADATSRSAVRAEIDRAVADQKAKERGATLAATEEKQSEQSGRAVADARSTQLNNAKEATKREQARMAEEKRKAEEALKSGALPPAPAPEAAAPALPAPAAGAPGVSGQGASPMAPGSYTLGARWGAVGAWSRYHTGQDLPAPIGTPIRAAAAGVVLSPNGGGWAGNHVVIKHADGSATLYAHMNSALVHPGQTVTAGQQIGAVGMTGRTFGPHLHFEHYPQGVVGNPYVTDDPYAWMMRLGVRL